MWKCGREVWVWGIERENVFLTLFATYFDFSSFQKTQPKLSADRHPSLPPALHSPYTYAEVVVSVLHGLNENKLKRRNVVSSRIEGKSAFLPSFISSHFRLRSARPPSLPCTHCCSRRSDSRRPRILLPSGSGPCPETAWGRREGGRDGGSECLTLIKLLLARFEKRR